MVGLQCSLDVLEEEDEVTFVGRALLELGNEMAIDVGRVL